MSSKIDVEKIINNERENMFLPIKYNLPTVKDYRMNTSSEKIYNSIFFDRKIFHNSNVKITI